MPLNTHRVFINTDEMSLEKNTRALSLNLPLAVLYDKLVLNLVLFSHSRRKVRGALTLLDNSII